MDNVNDVPLILRREIEALIAGPLIQAFIGEFGRERTLGIADKVIKSLAKEAGKSLAEAVEGNSLAALKKSSYVFSKGGVLENNFIEATPEKLVMNTTRCGYAEMFRKHNLQDLGYLLCCGRDFALIEGFNPEIKLTRTQTIMEGGKFCDFCFTMKE